MTRICLKPSEASGPSGNKRNSSCKISGITRNARNFELVSDLPDGRSQFMKCLESLAGYYSCGPILWIARNTYEGWYEGSRPPHTKEWSNIHENWRTGAHAFWKIL